MNLATVFCRPFAILLCLTAASSFCVAGCGTSGTAAPVASTAVSANWQMNIEFASTVPALPTNPILNLYGTLTTDSGKVTGVLNGRPGLPSTCTTGITDLAVSGNVDAAGNYSLSFPMGGGTAQVQFALDPPRVGYLGTYQVTGGNCAQPSIALSAYQVPDISGTYSGVLQEISITNPTGPVTTGATSTVTVTLTQSTTPSSDGTYTLAGTVTSTGACTDSFSFTTGVVQGDSFSSQPNPFTITIPPVPVPQFNGAVDPLSTGTARSLLAVFFDSQVCPALDLSGVLSHS